MSGGASRGRRRTAWPALALLAALATGCGGGGGGIEPGPQATFSAPSFTSGPNEQQNVRLSLTTNRVAAGFQVDILSPPDVIPEIDGVAADGRVASLPDAVVQNIARGHARVLLFDPGGGDRIPAGSGPVLILNFRVDSDAPAGTAPIELRDGIVVNSRAETFEVELEPGQVTVQR